MVDLQEIRKFYEDNVYGQWRSGEKVSYTINKVSKRVNEVDPSNPFAAMFKLSTDDNGTDVEIHVEDKTFTVRAYLPEKSAEGPVPFLVCMHPIMPKDWALNHGCALIFMDTSMIAEDNCLRKGIFYELYPYTDDPKSQTGELMAWGWGVSKVLDAVEAGLGDELHLDINRCAVTGVSRWGKATAVCGAFEPRLRLTIPTCSGAGGLALWDYQSEGKTYDLSKYDLPADYTYSQNEPLSCLQSDGERGWFNDAFLRYEKYEDIPVNQDMLPVLASGKDRYYCIVAAWTKEDWVNAPAMWECYERAKKHYRELGLEDHLFAHFHKEGHAILEEDLEYIWERICMQNDENPYKFSD